MNGVIRTLRERGVLSPIDEHFTAAISRISGEENPEVLLACALVSLYVNRGHVCLNLPRFTENPTIVDDAGEVVTGIDWPAIDRWMESLRSSVLVSDGSAATPLVLDGTGRLYLRRYWEHQKRLCEAVLARAGAVDESIDSNLLRDGLDRLFGSGSAKETTDQPDWQRIAAMTAVRRRFCVISGGPGTGKTFTVVKILALFIEQALHAGRRPPRLTLAAPTGKAAARLVESVRRNKAKLACAEEVLRAIPETASTIHRALGSIGGSGTRFRHHADNPLVTDAVLVDEASMVDLALMSRLADATPPSASLILIGDQDQLASVEAGAVLGDICNTGVARTYSHAMAEAAATLTGCRLPFDTNESRAGGLGDCIVQLTHSYRYGERGGIGVLARAINAGDGTLALSVLHSAEHPEVSLAAPPADGHLSKRLRTAVVQGFRPYLKQQEPEAQLRAFENVRILCAHRRGPQGMETMNRLIEKALAEAGLLHTETRSYAGRPVMVTENDYQLGLFNGDVGLICNSHDDGGSRLACFVAPDGRLRRLAPSRLPGHETVFAMTVHKSQGSEFDEVAILLPTRPSPVLSRELLYTAVTRARRKVTIYGTPEVVTAAVAQRIDRASGLRELLWGQTS
jgi:exodeoxyribonuclease V alpha subunit